MNGNQTKLMLVGCGRMGSALLEAWVGQSVHPYAIAVIDERTPPVSAPASVHQLHVFSPQTPLEEIGLPDAVLFAVKPQVLPDVLARYASAYGDAPLYMSVAAGKSVAFYQQHLGSTARIIRIMPNTPATVGLGVSALYASANCKEEDKSTASRLTDMAGISLWLSDEEQMHAVTALSGSGPAYVFYFMECMMRTAMDMGLDEETARKLTLHTVHGSAEMAVCQNEPLDALRKQVTSPGGTTEAALERLMSPSGLLPLVHDAVEAAIHRSRALST